MTKEIEKLGLAIFSDVFRYRRVVDPITRNHGHFAPAVKRVSFCTTHAQEGGTRWRTE